MLTRQVNRVTERKSVKRKVITVAVIVGALALLIGSFFLRDICLRAGITECEKREILQVKSKYSAILDSIVSGGADISEYTITAAHGGLFRKSVILSDENGEPLCEKLSEELAVLCHTYCYGVEKRDNAVRFSFNNSGTKQLVYSAEDISDNETSALGDNWYYYEKVTAVNG